MITIRRATKDDIGYIVTQLADFSVAYGTRLPLFHSPSDVWPAVEQMVEHAIVLMAVSNEFGREMAAGFIAGIISPHPFNKNIRVLAEHFWWVNPAWRKSRAGAKLLQAFLAIGKQNADWVTMSMLETTPIADKHLVKRGFHLHERAYLMEVC